MSETVYTVSLRFHADAQEDWTEANDVMEGVFSTLHQAQRYASTVACQDNGAQAPVWIEEADCWRSQTYPLLGEYGICLVICAYPLNPR